MTHSTPMHSRAIGLCALGASALIAYSGCAAAVDADYDVRRDDLTAPGQFAAGLHATYAPSGTRVARDDGVRSGFHFLQLSPNFSWGLTEHADIGLQLFTSAGPRGEYRMGGAKIELALVPWKPQREDDDGFWAGAAIEIGRLPRTTSKADLDAEVKALLGLRRGRWTFAINPAMQFGISGPGGEGRPGLGVKAAATFRLADAWSVGVEHYAELGELGKIGPLNQHAQHTFAIVEWEAKDSQFNLGVGRGLNDYSERWVLKAVIGFPIGR